MELKYLRIYEPSFIQFLLNGIADDKLEIGPQCIQFLEDHGKRMKDALKALGEEFEIENKQIEDIKQNTRVEEITDTEMASSS